MQRVLTFIIIIIINSTHVELIIIIIINVSTLCTVALNHSHCFVGRSNDYFYQQNNEKPRCSPSDKYVLLHADSYCNERKESSTFCSFVAVGTCISIVCAKLRKYKRPRRSIERKYSPEYSVCVCVPGHEHTHSFSEVAQ